MMDDSGELLVVDDEQFLRDAVATLLSSLGFTVKSAGTGTEALHLARTRPFDLLILDVMLPDLDGFEIVQRLRRDRSQVPAQPGPGAQPRPAPGQRLEPGVRRVE